MASIEFHLRTSLRKKRSAGSVFIRVIHRRRSSSVTTPWKLYPGEWDALEKKVILRAGNDKRFFYLREAEREMENTYGFLLSAICRLSEEGEFSASDVTALYRRHLSGCLFSSYVDKLSEDLIADGRERTARGYRTVRNRILNFYGNDLSFKQFTSSLMYRFQTYMLSEGKEMNTVSFYMRNLRAIYNRAIKEHLIEAKPENPFSGVYTGVHTTKKRALSKEDMALLQAWDPFAGMAAHGKHAQAQANTAAACSPVSSTDGYMIAGLRRAQQLFLFSFLSRGMSFVDMAFLRKADIQAGIICYRRRKTGQLLEVTVTPAMQAIMDQFTAETGNSPYVFPLIRKPGENERLQYESALRTQNNRLKRLAELLNRRSPVAKVKNNDTNNPGLSTAAFQLSSHVARHTWATMAKAAEIPIGVISEGLGHTSERTTMIYLGAFDGKVLDRANRKVEKFIKSAG